VLIKMVKLNWRIAMRTILKFARCLFLIVLAAATVSRLTASSPAEGLPDHTGMAITELEFRDVTIQPAPIDGYTFGGRIKNKSKHYTLQSVEIRIVFYDCATRLDAGTCKIIGERKEPIYIYGDLLNVAGNFVWRYEVLSTQAGL